MADKDATEVIGPDKVATAQLPEKQRHYIGTTDIAVYRKQGKQVYEGDRGGAYISIGDHHASDLGTKAVKVLFAGKELRLHQAPNHGHDKLRYLNAEGKEVEAYRNNPPMIPSPKEKGKFIKAKPIDGTYVKRNRISLLNGAREIPADAVDVHVAKDKNRPIQAVYRLTPDGRKFVIKTPEALERIAKERWEHFDEAREPLEDLILELEDKPIKDMTMPEKVIYVASITGIRHGQSKEPRLGADGKPTGEGLLTLNKSHITSIDDEHVRLQFKGKHDRPQDFTFDNPKLVAIFNELNNSSSDRVFEGATEATNNAYLKKATGNAHAKVKNFRTLLATNTAEQLLETEIQKLKVGEDWAVNKKEFEQLQHKVGLAVGIKLGHFKYASVKGPDGKVLKDEDGEAKKEWMNHSGEAIKSYIRPKTWDAVERKPEPVKKAILSTDDSLRQMQKAIQDLQKAITPDWHMKGPNEERDIDEWAEARQRKGENRAFGFKQPNGRPHKGTLKLSMPTTRTWMESLNEQGFSAPIIKGVNPEGTRMWLESGGQQFVAFLGMNGSARVEKATFKAVENPRRKPTVRTAVPTPDLDDMDEAPERGI